MPCPLIDKSGRMLFHMKENNRALCLEVILDSHKLKQLIKRDCISSTRNQDSVHDPALNFLIDRHHNSVCQHLSHPPRELNSSRLFFFTAIPLVQDTFLWPSFGKQRFVGNPARGFRLGGLQSWRQPSSFGPVFSINTYKL